MSALARYDRAALIELLESHDADEVIVTISDDGALAVADYLVCQDCGATQGVEYRTTPDRKDMRAFPRCESCFTRRLEQSERNLELQSDVPPGWFDPADAGESWDEP